MSKFLDWFVVAMAIIIIVGVLCTGEATVTAVVCGWACVVVEKISNIMLKKEIENK